MRKQKRNGNTEADGHQMSNAVTIGISSIVAVGTVVALGVFFYPGWEGNRGTDSAGVVSGEKAQEVKARDLFELPKLDVENSCQRDYPNQDQRSNCVTNEHLSYDLLKGAWLDIPLDVRKLCVSRTMAKQSYYDLSYCISDSKPK
jgi:hypothetical protein